MKKALLALLFVAIFMPFTMAQDNANRTISTTQVTRCQSYIWNVNGQTYTASTVETVLTQDTLYVLDLTITQPGTSTETLTVNACSYSWRNMTCDSSATYSDTVEGNADLTTCDSIHVLNLTLTGILLDSVSVSACGSHEWHDSVYTVSGSHVWNDTAMVSGCPHQSILNLSIVSQMNSYDTLAHCGYYNFNGTDVLAPFDTTYTIEDTVSQCDTIVHFHLDALINTVARVEAKKSCGPYTWYDTVLTASDTFSRNCLDTVTMCVTNRTIALTLIPQRISELDTVVTACNGFAFSRVDNSFVTDPNEIRNQTITKDTSFTYHMVMTDNSNARFCFDSTVNMTIDIKAHSNRDTVVFACDRFFWDRSEATYASTPEKAPKFKVDEKNAEGCDSNIVLQLTIKKSPVISAINGEWNIQAGETAVLYPTCTQGADYLWNYKGQTSTEDTLRIENCQGNFDVSLMATYKYDTVNTGFACHDTSWISIVTFVGINDVANAELSLYPNPTVGQLNIESNEAVNEVAIFNALGQQVAINRNLGNKNVMNLSSLSKGTYTLRISLQNGETIIRKIILTR